VHGRPLSASRPKHFFREDGPMPDVVSLSFARPRDSSTSRPPRSQPWSWKGTVHQAGRRGGTAAKPVLPSSGASVSSRNAGATPGSREPRRQLNPRVAARSKWSRIEACSATALSAAPTPPPAPASPRASAMSSFPRHLLATSLHSGRLRARARAGLTSPPFRNRSPLVLDDGGGPRHVVPFLRSAPAGDPNHIGDVSLLRFLNETAG